MDTYIPVNTNPSISVEKSLNLSQCFMKIEAIEKDTNAMDSYKSAGPDGIPQLFSISLVM